jgi:hypothetical protein
MVTFANPNSLKAGVTQISRLQRNAKNSGVELPSRQEMLESGTQAYLDISSPEALSGYARTADTVAGFAWMGADIALPALVAGSAGAMNYAGKGMGAMGLVGPAGSLKNTSNLVSSKYKLFTETPLSSLKSGEALAATVNAVASPFYRAAAAFNKRTGLFSNFANKAATKQVFHTEKANTLAASISNIPQDLASAVKGLLGVQHGDAQGLVEAGTEVSKLLDTHSAVLGKADSKTVKQIIKHNEKAHVFAQKSMDWGALATGEHHTLEAVRNASLKDGVSGGLLSVASVASTVATTMDTVSDVKAFRQLVADLTGKKVDEVNSGDALFAELPYGGQVARRALLSNAGPRGVLEAINTVFNIKMIKGSHMSMLMFALPAVLSQAVGMLTSGNVLDVYKEMKKNEAAGQMNLPDQYAQLIGLTHKELHQRGGGSSSFAQEIGRIYADRHASVRETLQAVVSGQVDRELHDIQQHNVQSEKSADVPSAQIHQVDEVKSNALVQTASKVPNELLKNTPSGFAERLMAEHHPASEAIR